MHTRNTLQSIPKLQNVSRLRHTLSVLPIMAATLMLGLQPEHANTVSPSIPETATVGSANLTPVDQQLPATLRPHDTTPSPSLPEAIAASTAQLTPVEQPLPKALASDGTAPLDDLKNSEHVPVAQRSTNATSMTGARVAMANFTTTSVKTPKSKVASETAQIQYEFKQRINQPLFAAVVSSPFAIGFGDDARLAIWNENSQFALVSKPTKFVIMLDPGHGGTDPGSVGHNGLQEKTLTLDIAKRTKRLLSENKHLSVLLTRSIDTGMSRDGRVHKVKRSQADMFVSIHLNHLPQPMSIWLKRFYAAPHNILESIETQRVTSNTNGMMQASTIFTPNLAFTHGSKKLASIMQKRVFDEVIDNNPATDDAGVKADTLFILTRSFTPGALIELSCLSNVKEAERLKNSAYRQKLAEALANGIREYLATPAAKHQFGSEV